MLKHMIKLTIALWLIAGPIPLATSTAKLIAAQSTNELAVMSWNIWRGGREDGETIGPDRVVELIRQSGADVVAMQETYGSGERISEALGFHFAPRGTNVSILSRYPVVEDLSVHEEFMCVGALIELPDSSRVAVYSIWLPYSAEIWEAETRDVSRPEAMIAACQASHEKLTAMYAAIEARLADAKYDNVPVVIAGDFNSMSHLDYGEVGLDQYHAVIDWPTSHILTQQGFVDTYRACNPHIDRARDSTWTPRFPEQEQDRIDFIYVKATDWRATYSRVLRDHGVQFPSDHAAVVTIFERSGNEPISNNDNGTSIRAVSYNIKHGHGMDGVIDLDRTAKVLRDLKPDFVGLQEVDLGATRSGHRNQVNDLAHGLSMHPAFGSFMEFQEGRYGMAILSRYPIVDVTRLPLPGGSEPRIALIVEARLPEGGTVLVVNVHFDWVEDDASRFRQAIVLAEYLRTVTQPYILLGDFNDEPGSRTLALFEELTTEIEKSATSRFTFPSNQPEREIDYIFCAPKTDWISGHTTVVAEAMVSDHRPIVTDLVLRSPD
jgi:endonuclease/exonuclease/phosphatase family metal-dependent hydrolase